MQTLTLEFQPAPIRSAIHLGNGILNSKNLESLSLIAEKWSLFADEKVAETLAKPLLQTLSELSIPCELTILHVSEKIKSRKVLEKLQKGLFERGHRRRTGLIGMGGGTLLDLIGYTAATFCRGIPYISIPTTLLAMTDASIGGKCGINTKSTKNGIGAFYFPSKIFIDINALSTLSPLLFNEGLIETIKHALIADASLFNFIEEENEALAKKEEALLFLIEKSINVKKMIVEADPYEEDIRHTLNLGHTIGHAIEVASRYRLSHGHAVRLGLIGECFIAKEMGYLDDPSFKRIEKLLKRFDFKPISLKENAVMEATLFDKKGDGKKIAMVILNAIGKAAPFEGKYLKQIPEALVKRGIQHALSCHY